MNCDINKNKRLSQTFDKFYEMDTLPGRYVFDCYNKTVRKDIHHAVTTRISDSNCSFLCEKSLDMKKYRIRKLTPREAGRLMDVEDDDITKMLESGLSDSALYKMYGNSIVVSCMVHMFSNLLINRPIKKDTGLW